RGALPRRAQPHRRHPPPGAGRRAAGELRAPQVAPGDRRLYGAHAMKIGLVGFPGSGKTTVFNALTGLSADTGAGAARGKTNLGVVKVPDRRVDALAQLFQPKKKTYAEVMFTD